MRSALFPGVALFLFALPAFALEVADYRLVDLSHAYGSDTLYWPTAPSKFEKKELAYGETEGGFFYSAYSVCTPEHGGTHLDAPLHFSAKGTPADKIPLEKLVAPAVVIDASDKAASDRNYRLSAEDVRAFEAEHGRIEAGAIVLLRTDWSRHWPDAMEYLGENGEVLRRDTASSLRDLYLRYCAAKALAPLDLGCER